MSDLKVMTLNTWATLGPWEARMVEVAAWVERVQPDVLCLQEVIEFADGSLSIDSSWSGDRVFIGKPAPEWCGAPPGSRFGVAVLSRWPIEASEGITLPSEPGHPHFLLHARTNALDMFSTHLEPHPGRGILREHQVLAIHNAITTQARHDSPLPPVLAGDFNARPDTTEMRFLAGLASIAGRSTYYQDAWRVAGDGPGDTWVNRNPFAAALHVHDSRIDFIFVGDNFGRGDATESYGIGDGTGRVSAARLVCHEPLTGVYASDHFGIVAEIAWPQRQPTGTYERPAPGAERSQSQ